NAMLLRFLIWSTLALCLGAVQAGPLKLDLLRVGSKTYSNVTVVGANATDLYFTHDRGIANVKLKYVDAKIQKKFNYDPKAAEEAERQQSEDDAQYMGG